jgi:alanine-synthesizing transaminase
MKFSTRTGWDLSENELAAAVRARVAAGSELVDLTASNPTACGFDYEPERLLAALSEPAAARYESISLGTTIARSAVAKYYRDAGADVAVERICLTTSTSEAYSFLFRLLCDPGDEVLVARPSYPLFEFLAQLDDVQLREYPLLYDPNADEQHGWSIDMHSLEAAITERTRAVIVVHPNNPTGNFASDTEREALERICADRGLALIVDEVFLDYAIGEKTARSFAEGESACLRFVLSGISKVCGLPQMKASWIAAYGPKALVDEAMERIEVIADTFLSMNAPVQFALPIWLERRHSLQSQIRDRCATNLRTLDARLEGSSAQRLVMEGGWTAVVRVPRTVGGLPFAEAALGCGVLVQPGEFYGLPEGRIVLSLLTPCDIWKAGLELLPVDWISIDQEF